LENMTFRGREEGWPEGEATGCRLPLDHAESYPYPGVNAKHHGGRA